MGENGVKVAAETDFSESKAETLTMGGPGCDGDGEIVVRDSVGEVRVSGDELGVVKEDVEKVSDVNVISGEEKEGDKVAAGDDFLAVRDAVNEVRVSGDEVGIVMEDVEKSLDVSGEGQEGDMGVVGSNLSSEHDAGGGVSGDEPATVSENAENVLEEKVVSNEVKAGGKAVAPASDLDIGGDTVVQDSVCDASVSADVRDIAMEKNEKVLLENVVEEEEKDGKYRVADMVWAKVKNYPWWPGQIFDPSASTDKAKKYSNKKAFFVAYYGDQSFAWNKASNIKPFRKNFSKMEKQSNSKGFCHAVNCALDEASRRIDFGLACSCLSKEVYGKIKTQVFVNAGIKSEASRIDGGDRFSTVATFKPENIVRSVQDLAREHFDGYSKLEVMSVRTQLLAYYRWNGYKIADSYEHLPWEEDKAVEEKDHTNMTQKESSRDKVAENAKTDSVSEKLSSKKRKLEVCDSVPSKKEKRITDTDPKGSLSLSNGNNKMKKIGAKRATVEDVSDSPLLEEDNLVEDAKLASGGEKVYTKRRKPKASDLVTSKQEQNMTEMTKEGSLNSFSGKDKVKTVGTGKAIVEDDSEPPWVEEDKVVEDAKPASVYVKVSSKKRKSRASDSVPSKKRKGLTNMTTKGDSSVYNEKSKRKENGSKIIITEGNGVKEESQNDIGDKKSLIPSPQKSFKIGDSIMRIAKQLSESPSILKKESQESRHGMKKNSKKRGKNDKLDEQTENSPTLQKVPKTDRKQKKKDRKLVDAIQLEE
nr:uncharacterized protein LOC122585518 isoform X2 [Erigeron canadensis]